MSYEQMHCGAPPTTIVPEEDLLGGDGETKNPQSLQNVFTSICISRSYLKQDKCKRLTFFMCLLTLYLSFIQSREGGAKKSIIFVRCSS